MDLAPGTKCTVHMSIPRQRKGLSDCWVVTVKGKVYAYTDQIVLENAEPNYIPSQWKRIQEQGCRKVYAKIKGILARPGIHSGGEEVHCNPHRAHDFTRPDGTSYTGSPVAEFKPGQSFFTI